MLSRQRLLALALAAPFALTPTAARANGKFPSADFLVAAPNDPATLLARTTFGLLLSKDQGSHWSWVCEGAALFKNYEPAVALTGSGHMVLAYIDGVGAAGPALCDYAKKPGGFEGVFVVDVSIDPDTPSTVYGVSAQGGINVTKVYRSDDDGESWVQAGVDLPKNFLGKTLELPNGAEPRIYVSGQDTSTGAVLGRIARSVDDGESWELFDVPGSGIGTAPFLGAVDPTDPDRLYVRLDGAPGQLLVSQDAGESWTTIFTGTGFLKGFALSPDGQTVLVGGDLDGIHRASTTDFVFEKISEVGARCLRWEDEGLYVCGDEILDGFTLGVSQDGGDSFTSLLHLPCLEGPLDCAAETSVGAICPAEWPAMATQIGASPEACAAYGAGGGGQGGAGGASTTSAGGGGETSGAGGSAAATSGSGGLGGADDGCGCSVPGGGGSTGNVALSALAAAVYLARAAARRRRSRSRWSLRQRPACAS
jgi:MYXO-CTERM domain-containing protein